jgi:TatD DNase family protein
MQRFDADRESVLERASAAGVTRVLVPALDLESAKRVLALIGPHPQLCAAVGFHPTELYELDEAGLAALQQLTTDPRVVAIGEIGLDYHWIREEARQAEQQSALGSQLDLAEACSLPVVLHMREQDDIEHGACADDLLRILADWVTGLRSHGSALADRPGVLHSFSGSLDIARQAIELGFYIGITGPVTYPNSEKRREIVRQLPIERLLIETDAPYLTPQSHRGQRNEPAFVADIADRIAHIQSRTASDVARATSNNASRLFAWGEPD